MLVVVTGSAPAWRTALGELPIVRRGRWAVGGSACLALHGLPVDPKDLDLLVDHVAAAELVDGLRGALVSDEVRWDRGDVRAVRRALAMVSGVEVEILEGAEAVGPTGEMVVATPDLDHVDWVIVSGRPIPVLPLPAMQVLLDATGNRERAAMVAKVLVRQGTAEGFRFGPQAQSIVKTRGSGLRAAVLRLRHVVPAFPGSKVSTLAGAIQIVRSPSHPRCQQPCGSTRQPRRWPTFNNFRCEVSHWA